MHFASQQRRLRGASTVPMNSLSADEEFSENLQEGRLAQLGERLVYTRIGASVQPTRALRSRIATWGSGQSEHQAVLCSIQRADMK
jgi:hypothetical protein